MGLISFLSCLFLGFTILLMLKKSSMGKLYMVFGLLTFIFVIGYASIPSMPKWIQNFAIFIIFSLMMLLFGIMNGTFIKILKRSNKFSQIVAVVSTIVLILLVFNVVGCMTYMYIPVLLYMLQDKLNNHINKINKIV
ncbi:MAG: hypothetical protein RR942_07400 [Romboutsia sp.]